MPRGGVAYLSGQADKNPLPQAAVKSMTTLLDVVKQLNLHPSQIVQLKVFIDSAAKTKRCVPKLKQLFPDQLVPPVIFVEWIASAPVEIEMVAHLPRDNLESRETLRFLHASECQAFASFSKAALVQTERQIFIRDLPHVSRGAAKCRSAICSLNCRRSWRRAEAT